MLNKSAQKSMTGGLIGAILGLLLMGIPGALLGGLGIGLTVYIMERSSQEKAS